MQGLRGQENDKFNRFFEIVQNAAKEKGCVFFADAGDGNDFETATLEGEDLTGWLVPHDKVSDFEPLWEKDDVSDDWSNFFGFAVWEDANSPKIKFII